MIEKRREIIELWNKARAQEGRSLSEMPILHVFLVIPMPERAEMIPRTYDALAHLGQQDAMIGQQKIIDKESDRVKAQDFAPWYKRRTALPAVVSHANEIQKPDTKSLEKLFGIKVCTVMLNACGSDGKKWLCREIYIHSKLLIVDDVFCTLGSANLNQRSMIGDSELNMATIDQKITGDLRKKVWSQLSGGEADGGVGTKQEMSRSFDQWKDIMKNNHLFKLKHMKITGFILPLYDERSSMTRLG
ncbi:phospholipase D-like domain-containing protein [Pseudoduganella dura]|uniref:phospholipase D-like domain-containing protein n=1 Tax=Pseudoduganella dura TaxID=321982 RepID=UPI0019C4A529|nr:phospholipase D-like domain-containing protein [Pseudoduganella dura]GGX92731.1 hypothetical protein GCM10007386_24550 [Pseudoduganella dura]